MARLASPVLYGHVLLLLGGCSTPSQPEGRRAPEPPPTAFWLSDGSTSYGSTEVSLYDQPELPYYTSKLTLSELLEDGGLGVLLTLTLDPVRPLMDTSGAAGTGAWRGWMGPYREPTPATVTLTSVTRERISGEFRVLDGSGKELVSGRFDTTVEFNCYPKPVASDPVATHSDGTSGHSAPEDTELRSDFCRGAVATLFSEN
jgi:hypothetical protein